MKSVIILFEIGTENKKLINIIELAEYFADEYSTGHTAWHVFAICDTSNTFKGTGNAKPNRSRGPQIPKNSCWARKRINSTLLLELEEFIYALCGDKRFNRLNKLRLIIIKEKHTDMS